jgi:hypothetical protein
MFELCQSSVAERGFGFGLRKVPVCRGAEGAMPTYGSGRAVAYSPQLSLLKIVRLGCRI